MPRGRPHKTTTTIQGSKHSATGATKASGSANRPLLKWVGSKQRFAREIVSRFPQRYGTYFEPFLGSGAVLGTLTPQTGFGTDAFEPLIEIWCTLSESPDTLKRWYADRRQLLMSGDKLEIYERIKASYNAHPNGADLLFICRTCYGGVIRFRKDGYISTPCGIHSPIPSEEFSRRVDDWHLRVAGTEFLTMDFQEAMEMAKSGDVVYCDPPYTHAQSILYGAQEFDLRRLFDAIARCKSRGVYVALSIDGSKRSGDLVYDLPTPSGLFTREISVNVGRSTLKRFQMEGQSLEGEVVADRLLLTY